ncbi:regucalcin [Kluyveromyces lactis]|uniref:KLLA0F04301p n=1 Tax=Kluyveromyces lactis (strain ATCC 8585 / CBS 2359 / DSM 70799 / NBRC 1267 / NRRL Y-1140 / WM37) TaxID=284590 RepID=Q6CLB5_KLULA|nr:uncharacterized protein KLLA0_F04301g [Kluyveromyces lactis]CAG97982.1 KLLA0F04301p [Kluyveromyces lactis]|eukprot:XP_455274.1 uncharacterized protein KLLA0_F04301g [Kluyveromyces lactis]
MTEVTETVHKNGPYYFDSKIRLSEGISYAAESKALFWIDIYNAYIHRVTDIDDISTHTVWHASVDNYEGLYPFTTDLPERIGAIFPIDRADGVEEVYFGAKYGIARMNYTTLRWQYLVHYSDSGLQKDWTGLRSNDGNVSPDGEIFIGIMNDFHCTVDSEDPKGALLKVNLRENICELVIDKLMIPNAINWSQDGTTVYFTDSLNFSIYKYPYQDKNLIVEDKALFIDIKKFNSQFDSPEPDGSFIDPDTHNIITAVWSTSTVQRYDTKGDLIHKWTFPETNRISACTLAQGHMFVTTANEIIEDNASPEGLGGSIFKVENVSTYMGSSKRNPITAEH